MASALMGAADVTAPGAAFAPGVEMGRAPCRIRSSRSCSVSFVRTPAFAVGAAATLGVGSVGGFLARVFTGGVTGAVGSGGGFLASFATGSFGVGLAGAKSGGPVGDCWVGATGGGG